MQGLKYHYTIQHLTILCFQGWEGGGGGIHRGTVVDFSIVKLELLWLLSPPPHTKSSKLKIVQSCFLVLPVLLICSTIVSLTIYTRTCLNKITQLQWAQLLNLEYSMSTLYIIYLFDIDTKHNYVHYIYIFCLYYLISTLYIMYLLSILFDIDTKHNYVQYIYIFCLHYFMSTLHIVYLCYLIHNFYILFSPLNIYVYSIVI